jgi:hypothetical protein
MKVPLEVGIRPPIEDRRPPLEGCMGPGFDGLSPPIEGGMRMRVQPDRFGMERPKMRGDEMRPYFEGRRPSS